MLSNHGQALMGMAIPTYATSKQVVPEPALPRSTSPLTHPTSRLGSGNPARHLLSRTTALGSSFLRHPAPSPTSHSLKHPTRGPNQSKSILHRVLQATRSGFKKLVRYLERRTMEPGNCTITIMMDTSIWCISRPAIQAPTPSRSM